MLPTRPIFARAAAAALVVSAATAAHGQQPWQRMQMPTAAATFAAWYTTPAEYGPEPYYGFNGAMDETVIRRDLDQLKALGFRAVTVQAGRGMPVPYLSADYFKLFRTFIEEAKKRGMRVWIVDDAGYPSGFAGGKFTEQKPELRMQALEVTKKIPVAGGATIQQPVPSTTVGVLAVNTADQSAQVVPITGGAIHWTAPAGDWQLQVVEHVFRTSPTRSDTNPKNVKDQSQSLEDYLDPAATAQYLAFTHEQYKRYVGDEFGKTIMGFRGDEPDYSIRGFPWTPALFAKFQQMKGYDVRPLVAGLFAPHLSAEQQRVKADYWEVFAALFRDGFFKPQGEWCATNHLEYQVHLNHEEMEMALTRSEGDFFQDMRYVQVPGIDAIWHQIDKDTIADYPRLASSVSHLYGHPRAFTESFAAYRPAPDVTEARYILDEQFVRGVNLVEVMYFPSTSKGPRPAPSFMADPAFPALMQYTQRMSYLMSMGRPTAQVALYLPSSSMWLGDAKSDETFVSAERLLSEHQVDFDIVDEDALARSLTAGKGTLTTASGNRFRTVILPAPQVLSEQAVTRLRAFVQGGGHVVFLGSAPSLISGRTYRDAKPATAADFAWATIVPGELAPTPTPPQFPPSAPPAPQNAPATMVEAVEKAVPAPFVSMDTPDLALRLMTRRLKDAEVTLFFNEGPTATSHTLRLRGSVHKAELWDPQTGERQPLTLEHAGKNAAVRLSFAPYQTRVLVTY